MHEVNGAPGDQVPPADGNGERAESSPHGNAAPTHGDRASKPGDPAARGVARRQIGDYELLERIGGGGMGDVYRALQTSLEREVALKLLSVRVGDNSNALERFMREARALGVLQHPSIVAVYDTGIDDVQPYIAMQLIKGPSLQRVLAEGGPLSVARALDITLQIARALGAAHEGGVVHRDIKPGNVLLEGDEKSVRLGGNAFLADFGLAHLANDASVTRTGELVGTPSYMSPEQAQGRPGDRAADIYALGATLYTMLSGKAPHEGSSHAAVLARVLHDMPVPVRELNRSVDRDTAVICEKAMAREPGMRYCSAAELAADVQRRVENRPIRARPPGLAHRCLLWLKRNPQVVAAAAVVLVACLIAFGIQPWLSYKSALDGAEKDIARGEVQGAKEKLQRNPWVPSWMRDTYREVELSIRASEIEGDLEAAFREVRELPREAQACAIEDCRTYLQAVETTNRSAPTVKRPLVYLCRALRESGRAAEAYRRVNMWRRARQECRNALGGIKGLRSFDEALCAAALVRTCLKEVTLTALTCLLETGQDDRLLRLWAAAQGSMRDIPYETLEQALGLDDEPENMLRMGEVESFWWEAIRERTKAGGDGNQPHGSSGWDAANRTLDILYSSITPAARLVIARSVETMSALQPVGRPLLLSPRDPFMQATGDLDGDRSPELVVTWPGVLQILRCTRHGIEELGGVALAEGTDVSAMTLGDVDMDGTCEIVTFETMPESLGPVDSYLRAYRWEGGELTVRTSCVSPIHGKGHHGRHSMVVSDVNGDTLPEVVLGLSSGGTEGRAVLLVLAPFTPEAKKISLPPGGGDADVTCVAVADFDGDGHSEIACGTGPWAGWDIRYWRMVKGTLSGPFRSGALGSFEDAVPIDLGGADPCGLLVVKSSWLSFNEALPPPQHTGIEEGVYLCSWKNSQVRETGAEPVPGFRDCLVWRDKVGGPREDSSDEVRPTLLSVGRWHDGTPAFVASWNTRMEGRARQFIDLYRQGDEATAFTPHRISWHDGEGVLSAEFVELPAADSTDIEPGLVLLERSPGVLHARLFAVRSPGTPESLDSFRPRIREAYVRRMQYDKAEELCRTMIEAAPNSSARLDEWRRFAAVALWALDWRSLDVARLELTRLLGGAPPEIPAADLADARRVVERLAAICREGEQLMASVPQKLPRVESRDVLQSAGKGAQVSPAALACPATAGPSNLQLTFDLEIKEFAFNHSIFVGLQGPAPVDAPPPVRFGAYFAHSGGGGQESRHVALVWGDDANVSDIDRTKLLEDGKRYSVTLVRTSQCRVMLKVEELGSDLRRVFWRTLPAFGEDISSSDRGFEIPRKGADAVPRLDGNYRFGVFEVGGSGDPDSLIFSNLELRLAPVE